MITVFVPGPMHPDLFGGETPIMMPRQLRCYRVAVDYNDAVNGDNCDHVTVLAANDEEAQDIALYIVQKEADSSAGDFLVDSCEEIDDGKITPETILTYQQWRAGKHDGEDLLAVPDFLRAEARDSLRDNASCSNPCSNPCSNHRRTA